MRITTKLTITRRHCPHRFGARHRTDGLGDCIEREQPAVPSTPVVTASAEPERGAAADPLPPDSTLRFGTSRFRQGTAISSLSIAADGKFAVAASGGHVNGTRPRFDLTDGRVLYTLENTLERRFAMGEAVALSPDGKTLAFTGSTLGNTLHLFDAKTGKHLRKVEFPNTGGGTLTEWITFTPDGKRIALTQGGGNAVLLVDLEKGEVVRTFPHANMVYAAAFSPDGKLMAAGGYDSDKTGYFTRLWEVATGKELRILRLGAACGRSRSRPTARPWPAAATAAGRRSGTRTPARNCTTSRRPATGCEAWRSPRTARPSRWPATRSACTTQPPARNDSDRPPGDRAALLGRRQGADRGGDRHDSPVGRDDRPTAHAGGGRRRASWIKCWSRPTAGGSSPAGRTATPTSGTPAPALTSAPSRPRGSGGSA